MVVIETIQLELVHISADKYLLFSNELYINRKKNVKSCVKTIEKIIRKGRSF